MCSTINPSSPPACPAPGPQEVRRAVHCVKSKNEACCDLRAACRLVSRKHAARWSVVAAERWSLRRDESRLIERACETLTRIYDTRRQNCKKKLQSWAVPRLHPTQRVRYNGRSPNQGEAVLSRGRTEVQSSIRISEMRVTNSRREGD